MSDPKTQISARIHESTKQDLESYAEKHNLNRSQAIEKMTEQCVGDDTFVDEVIAARRDNALIGVALLFFSSVGRSPFGLDGLFVAVGAIVITFSALGYLFREFREMGWTVFVGGDFDDAEDGEKSTAHIDSRVRHLGGLLVGLGLLGVVLSVVLGGGV